MKIFRHNPKFIFLIVVHLLSGPFATQAEDAPTLFEEDKWALELANKSWIDMIAVVELEGLSEDLTHKNDVRHFAAKFKTISVLKGESEENLTLLLYLESKSAEKIREKDQYIIFRAPSRSGLGFVEAMLTDSEQRERDISSVLAATGEIVRAGDPSTQRVAPTGCYSWLRRGTLFLEYRGHGKQDRYLYCGKDTFLRPVSSLQRFSAMLSEQMDNSSEATEFLKSRFPELIIGFLGPLHAHQIGKSYIEIREDLPPGMWRDHPLAEVKRSTEVFKKYDVTELTIEKGKWRSLFYISLENGSVEQWKADGNLQPFSIDYLSKTQMEKEGSLVPNPPLIGE